VHVGRRGVARLAGVDDRDHASGSAEDQCGRQAGCASADDDYVVGVHNTQPRQHRLAQARVVAGSGKARFTVRVMTRSDREAARASVVGHGQVTAIASALDLVGSRLRRVRLQRGLTLTDVAEEAGISKSTLSRLENGQRRPSLELLLPLAEIYRVPIDDLVGAPEVGDPRIRLKPRQVNGRTVLPLTRPGEVQAWKILVPAAQASPNPRRHEGFEWLYVLSGRLRFILGDRDLVLEVGEAAQFDTRVPHWFGSTGEGPAEVLSVFSRPGEQMSVRVSGGRDGRSHHDPGARMLD